MKLFHLSDLHIGLKLMNRDLSEDQLHIFAQIAEYAGTEQPDAVVIAGDLYDKAIPSAEAVALFDCFVRALRQAAPDAAIMMISGNHDSAQRVNVFRSVLNGQGIHMIGLPPMQPEDTIETVTLTDEYGSVRFYLLPFVRPSMVKAVTGTDQNGNNLSYDAAVHALIEREAVDTAQRNVLVSHQFYLPAGKDADSVERMSSEIRTVGNIDAVRADILERFDYAALGHIHKPMKAGCETARYSGTPMACSFDEEGQEKAVLCVELREKGDLSIRELPLMPLHAVRTSRGELENVLLEGCADYARVILTDREELDVLDMQDRLRKAFPNLLEIRRENQRTVDYGTGYSAEEEMDPLELCCSFLGDTNEKEREILADVLNTVWKEGRR